VLSGAYPVQLISRSGDLSTRHPPRCRHSTERAVRLQCSGCGRSIRQGELSLTTSKPTFIQAAGDAMNVSEALSSSHWRCHVAGPP